MDFSEIDKQTSLAWENRRSNLRASFDAAQKSLSFSENLQYAKGIADSHKILGYCYWRFTNFSSSLEHSLKALDYYQKSGDLQGEADTLNSLGAVYMYQKNHEERLTCNLNCLEIRKKLGKADDISGSMNNIGETYFEKGDIENAEKWLLECIRFPGASKDSLAWAKHNMGKVYIAKNDLKNAEACFLECLEISAAIQYDVLITETCLRICELYILLSETEKAKGAAEKALALAKKNGAKEEIKSAYLLLSSIYEKEDVNNAFEFYKLFHQTQEEIFSESNSQRIRDITFQHEIENIKKEAEIERLKTVELKRAHDEITEQKSLLEQRNREIVDSIRYARLIQKAVLNDERKPLLQNHFIFYRPKDIVSGDFYWIYQKESFLYLGVADCTGHGVPGGFLTMLGITFLNEIIGSPKLLSPADILNDLRKKFLNELRLENSNNDGMDMSLCRIALSEKTTETEMQWAGANIPLWIIKHKQEKTLIEIKPDKQPIGKSINQTPFTNHSLLLNKGDTVYLSSDGFADQFGGPKGKKLKRSGLKRLLLESSVQSSEKQAAFFENYFDEWKGQLEQVDDVCLMGIAI
jgi:serine phosphatase RsbU (regulator of sigma subunit)